MENPEMRSDAGPGMPMDPGFDLPVDIDYGLPPDMGVGIPAKPEFDPPLQTEPPFGGIYRSAGFEMSLDVPITVTAWDAGLKVVEYRGTDGLLKPNDYLTRVASIPNAGRSFAINGLSRTQFEKQCLDRARQSQIPGQIAIYREDNVSGSWVSMQLHATYIPQVNLSTLLPFTVRATSGGVEAMRTGESPAGSVDRYQFQPSDIIQQVGSLSFNIADFEDEAAAPLAKWKAVSTRVDFEQTVEKNKNDAVRL